MLKLDGIGQRLRGERDRLGLSQSEFAEAGAVGRATIVRYETGTSLPSLDFLAEVQGIGVDVGVVLTGESTGPATSVLAKALTLVEDLLIKHDLELTPETRARLVVHVAALIARGRSPALGNIGKLLESVL